MTSSKFHELVARAKQGRVTLAERDELKRALPSLSEGEEIYDALFVIGKAGGPEDAAIMEHYLDYPGDPMLTRLALQVLCNWWGLQREYRTELLRFVAGVKWDLEDGGYVRLVAISATGELARESHDRPAIAALMTVYASDGEPDAFRRAAYSALLRAAGKAWAEVPGVSSDAWRDHPDVRSIQGLRDGMRRQG
jgi:hypothetical protein